MNHDKVLVGGLARRDLRGRTERTEATDGFGQRHALQAEWWPSHHAPPRPCPWPYPPAACVHPAPPRSKIPPRNPPDGDFLMIPTVCTSGLPPPLAHHALPHPCPCPHLPAVPAHPAPPAAQARRRRPMRTVRTPGLPPRRAR